MTNIVESLQKENDKLRAQIETLKIQLEDANNLVQWYMEQIRIHNIQKYQKTSESGFVYQLSLFDETEFIKETDGSNEEEEETVEVAAHTRKKKSKPDYSKMEVKTVHHDLKSDEELGPLKEVKPTIKEEIIYIPGQTKLVRHVIHNYIVVNQSDDEHTVFASGENYKKLIDKSIVSPSLLAVIIYKKYVLGQPLYRIEADFNRKNIPITRQDMSNWMLMIDERFLKVLVDMMKQDALKEDILYGDETTINCLQEKDRDKSYMWIQRTSPFSVRQIALYFYNKSREYDFAKEIYSGFKGYLHADGYGAYQGLEGIIVVACWAHVRRKVYEALESYSIDKEYRKCRSKEKKKDILRDNPSYAKTLELFEMIEALFSTDKKIHKETTDYNEIKALREERMTSIVDGIFQFAEEYKEKFLPKSKTGKAIHYLLDCGDNLRNFFKDGRLELTNNLGERTVKPFVMGRKAWLFANTSRGAYCSADLYSLCETAMANNLKPFEYLSYILEEFRKMDQIPSDPEALRYLLPYGNEFPQSMMTK